MPRSRRDFIAQSSLGLLGATIAPQTPAPPQAQTPGAPTVFGTAPPVGPKVSAETFAGAEKLMQVEMTPKDLAQAAGNWQQAMAPVYERRTGPRKLALGGCGCSGDGLEPMVCPNNRAAEWMHGPGGAAGGRHHRRHQPWR